MVRNLSWRADSASKLSLRDAGVATALTHAAMLRPSSEQTLRGVLCALWNVSGHCQDNKADIAAVPGALEFLVGLLDYRSQTNSLAVNENAGMYVCLSVRLSLSVCLSVCVSVCLSHVRQPGVSASLNLNKVCCPRLPCFENLSLSSPCTV